MDELKPGDKVDYLEMIEPFKKMHHRKGRKYWRCKCVCGTMVERREDYLRREKKKIKSCGCQNPLTGVNRLKGKDHPHWRGCGDLSAQYFNVLQHRAKKQELPFTLTIEEAWQLFVKQEHKCALTGLPLKFETLRSILKGGEQTASLDRIDSNKGYTLDNTQWLHKDVNKMKNEFDEDYFIKICHLIAKEHPVEDVSGTLAC